MNTLDKHAVIHVADLARLKIDDNDIGKYQLQLNAILTEIDKINKVNIDTSGSILIAPTTNINCYNEDIVGKMLKKEEVLKNASNKNNDYIVVPKVIE